MGKIQHERLKNTKASSSFGMLKFDENGFLVEPDLNEEQEASLLELKSFRKVLSDDERKEQLESMRREIDEDAGLIPSEEEEKEEDSEEEEEEEEVEEKDMDVEIKHRPEEDSTIDHEALIEAFVKKEGLEVEAFEYEQLTVKQIKKFASEQDVELEASRKDDLIQEIYSKLGK